VDDPAALLFDFLPVGATNALLAAICRQLCSATRFSAFYFLLFLAWLREILVVQKKFFIFSHITY